MCAAAHTEMFQKSKLFRLEVKLTKYEIIFSWPNLTLTTENDAQPYLQLLERNAAMPLY